MCTDYSGELLFDSILNVLLVSVVYDTIFRCFRYLMFDASRIVDTVYVGVDGMQLLIGSH